ncbi:hypothetical protein BJF90_18290 [Pseudonocardia sp. CNS-004]|nr:hypothetical protein BJF90_18290 [Pseudonocardia sp. CNS-004]
MAVPASQCPSRRTVASSCGHTGASAWWASTGSHRFWRLHCRILLAEAGAPDPDLRADVLLAALTAEQVRHWRHDEGHQLAELTRAMSRLARGLAAD